MSIRPHERTPSYTDRILWRTGNLLNKNIKQLCYCEPIDNFTTSDHNKPIRGAFDIIQLNDDDRYTVSECCRKSSLLHHYYLYWRSSRANHGHEVNSANQMLHLPLCIRSSMRYISHACMIIMASLSRPWIPTFPWYPAPRNYSGRPGPLWKSSRGHGTNKLRGKVNPHYYYDADDMMRWPHTYVVKNTLNPCWGEEEINCMLQEQDKHGEPNNVGGAILHIFAMESSPGENVIGSFAINLEYLYRLCHDGDAEWRQSSGIDELLLESAVDHHGITMHASTAHGKFVAWEINGPLVKDGRQTGVIRCSLLTTVSRMRPRRGPWLWG
jgi:hypothetical protein